jgi:hypothetical protein
VIIEETDLKGKVEANSRLSFQAGEPKISGEVSKFSRESLQKGTLKNLGKG